MRILKAVIIGMGMLTLPALAAPPGFYLAAAGGQAEQDFDLKDSGRGFINITTPIRPGASLVPFLPGPPSLDVDGKAFGANIAIGYRVNDYFAAELSYMDFGQAELTENPPPAMLAQLPPNIMPGTVVPAAGFTPRDPAAGAGILPARFRSEIEGPALTLLGSLPIATRWNVYLRGGVIFTEQDVAPFRRFAGRRVSFNDEVLLGGVGASYQLSSRFALRAEYLRSDEIGSRDFGATTQLEQFQLSILYQLP
jgi:hypothetical protein